LLQPEIQFIILDFSNETKLYEQLLNFKKEHGAWDYIIHCAGVTKCKDKSGFYKGNYIATYNFIRALEAADMVPQKFIYLSSLSIFGPIHDDSFAPISENDVPKPNTAYAESKIKAEEYIKSLPSFPYVILRPTGVYGPRERDYFLMVKSIKQHLDFSVGFSRQDITFVYVKDVVQAIFLSIEKDVVRRSYFISDDGVYSSRTFSDLIQKYMGIKHILHIKCPLFILKVVSLLAEFFAGLFGKASTLNSDKYKIMKQRNWRCDIEPLKKELGYKAQYPLERGVKEIIEWYKKRDGFEFIQTY
jgi:Nucleoside-diphosphate-sugar epimerases